MKKHNKITASGIIVFRNVNNNPELLGLIALPKHRKRSKGRYDVPKGRIDEGETPMQAALRECIEESSLSPKIIIKEPFIHGALALWVGEVDPDEEVICNKNPYTGELEHEGYNWIPIKEMRNNCLNYLRPFIIDAEKEIWKYFRLWSR